jgi:succinylarginine dihydrolase
MRTMNVALLAIFLSGALLLSCARQTPAPPATPAQPAVLGDGADAKHDRVDNVHQVRFIEIFLVGREASTGNIVAAVYNTMYTQRASRRRKTLPRKRCSRASISTTLRSNTASSVRP